MTGQGILVHQEEEEADLTLEVLTALIEVEAEAEDPQEEAIHQEEDVLIEVGPTDPEEERTAKTLETVET